MFQRLSVLTLFLAAVSFQAAPAADETRPNILLVMTDDMGYGDLGVTGNPVIRVPNLDRLAGESVEVETFYVCPVCAPTRASLMTGRYYYRTGVTDTYLGRAMMYNDEVTLAEMLREAGYRTGIFGKWHLGDSYPMRPQDQGFEEVLVHTGGGLCQPSGPPDNSYFDPSLLYNGERIQTEGYCSDVYVDYLIDFIETHRDEPFFAYLPFNCPHGPFQVAEEYKRPYDEMDMKPGDFPQKGHARKNVPGNTSAVYGMVENIDDNMGRLLKKLDELDLAENTIVIFLTDNGPNGDRYNGGMRAHKGSVYEGGVRTCFFVRWPARFEAGHKVEQFAAHIDVFPTLLEACGVAAPEGVHIDGRSILPLLEGEDVAWPDRNYCVQWHRGDYPVPFRRFAIRDNQYKLVHAADAPEGVDPMTLPLELYDMQNDPLEMRNIAAERPDVVRKMAESYRRWLEDVGRDHGYAGPKIAVGTEHENPVILTRQDWRGPQASWGAGGLGYWDLYVPNGGDFKIKVQADAAPNGGTVTLRLQGMEQKLEWAPGVTECEFGPITLKSSEAERLETWIDAEGRDKPYGARFVYVERIE